MPNSKAKKRPQEKKEENSLSVSRLVLSNFRNYSELDIEFSPHTIIITGENGSGKTNLLEAISLLVPGRGLRTAKLSTIDKNNGGKPWSVFANIKTPEGEVAIGTGRDTSKEQDKRIVKIDGKAIRGQAELSSYFSVCYLTPQMDQTFADGTTSRRSYLDRLTSSFYPEHIKHLSIYDHAKSERRHLLMAKRGDESWLSVLEKRMAEQAIAIAAARKETIQHLQEAIDDYNGVFPKAILSLDGLVEKSLDEMKALQAEENFQYKLKFSRNQDAETGHTAFGTHKSDFIVNHSEKNLLAEFCSTGEQKALLLSITMACAMARKQWFGATPVLLLDEVAAHLDSEKRSAFFDELNSLSAQSWLTGTDVDFFKDFRGKTRFLTIENSKVLG